VYLRLIIPFKIFINIAFAEVIMEKNKVNATLGITFALAILSLSLMNVSYTGIVFAQSEIDPGTPGEVGTTNNTEPYYPPLNETGPETIQSLENIEGSNAAILGNDTSISNPNNTLLDSTTVNEQEDCMSVPNQTNPDCP
jgi:hypothetical protein